MKIRDFLRGKNAKPAHNNITLCLEVCRESELLLPTTRV